MGEDVATREVAEEEAASPDATTMIQMWLQTRALPEEEKPNSTKKYALMFLPEDEAKIEAAPAREDAAAGTQGPPITTVTKYRLSKSLAARKGPSDAPDPRRLPLWKAE